MGEMVNLKISLYLDTANSDFKMIFCDRIICKLVTNRKVRAIYGDNQQRVYQIRKAAYFTRL